MIRWSWGGLSFTSEITVWMLVAVFGWVMSAAQILEAYRQRIYLRLSGFNGARMVLAEGFMRREIVRNLAQTGNIALGILAITGPLPPRPSVRGEIGAILVIWAACSIALNSFLDRRDRHRVLTAIRKLERPGLNEGAAPPR